MAMNISGLGNTYNGINTNSKQYKALKEKGWLSGIMQNEAMMSPEERIIYETFGGAITTFSGWVRHVEMMHVYVMSSATILNTTMWKFLRMPTE